MNQEEGLQHFRALVTRLKWSGALMATELGLDPMVCEAYIKGRVPIPLVVMYAVRYVYIDATHKPPRRRAPKKKE